MQEDTRLSLEELQHEDAREEKELTKEKQEKWLFAHSSEIGSLKLKMIGKRLRKEGKIRELAQRAGCM